MPIPNPWRIPAPLIWLAQNVKLKEPEARQESQQDKFPCTVFHVNVFSGAWEAVMWETHCRAFLSGLFFNNDEEKYMPLAINHKVSPGDFLVLIQHRFTCVIYFKVGESFCMCVELEHQVSQLLLFLWLAQAHITVSSTVHTLAQALLYTVLASGWREQMQSSEQWAVSRGMGRISFLRPGYTEAAGFAFSVWGQWRSIAHSKLKKTEIHQLAMKKGCTDTLYTSPWFCLSLHLYSC